MNINKELCKELVLSNCLKKEFKLYDVKTLVSQDTTITPFVGEKVVIKQFSRILNISAVLEKFQGSFVKKTDEDKFIRIPFVKLEDYYFTKKDIDSSSKSFRQAAYAALKSLNSLELYVSFETMQPPTFRPNGLDHDIVLVEITMDCRNKLSNQFEKELRNLI